MIYNFPFYPHFPTKSYRGYPHNANKNVIRTPNYSARSSTETNTLRKNNNKNHDIIIEKKQEKTYEKKADTRIKNTNDEKYFEILGIKLYSDDILLLYLIFFLYKEGVQDEYLFIALIMLLLS